MISSPAGNDLLFDEKLCEQGRNFCNKIWNALRLVSYWKNSVSENRDTPNPDEFVIDWFRGKLDITLDSINTYSFENFYLDTALKTLYGLVWDDFCSWYLE